MMTDSRNENMNSGSLPKSNEIIDQPKEEERVMKAIVESLPSNCAGLQNQLEVTSFEEICSINSFYKEGNEVIRCRIGKSEFDLVADSGSPIDILSEDAVQAIKSDLSQAGIPFSTVIHHEKPQGTKRYTGVDGGTMLEVLYRFEAEVTVLATGNRCMVDWHVIKGARINILSKSTSEWLKVLRVGIGVGLVDVQAKEEYPFVPVEPISLKLIEHAIPVRRAYFRVPVSLEDKVIQMLRDMERQGIIRFIREPSEWISPLVAVPKQNGDVRLCVNLIGLNKNLEYQPHPLPRLENLKKYIEGCKIFSHIDLKQAYYQLRLAEESKPLTAFYTPLGVAQFNRMPFGLAQAPAEFQRLMDQLFRPIEAFSFLDDILVAGKTVEEHDRILKLVWQTIKDYNLEINEDKTEYSQWQLNYMGFEISRNGLHIAESKVRTLKTWRRPESKLELKSFLGFIQFLAESVPFKAHKLAVLYELNRTSEPFQWTDEAQKAFEDLKEELIEFAMRKEALGCMRDNELTFLYTDASDKAISGILVQRKERNGVPRLIACVSRLLKDYEQRYATYEKEALAIKWATQALSHYLLGRRFTIRTDASVVKGIFGKLESGYVSIK